MFLLTAAVAGRRLEAAEGKRPEAVDSLLQAVGNYPAADNRPEAAAMRRPDSRPPDCLWNTCIASRRCCNGAEARLRHARFRLLPRPLQ